MLLNASEAREAFHSHGRRHDGLDGKTWAHPGAS